MVFRRLVSKIKLLENKMYFIFLNGDLFLVFYFSGWFDWLEVGEIE